MRNAGWSFSAVPVMVAALAIGSPPVQAQEVTLQPTAAERCLMPAREQRGAPEYPELEDRFRVDALVKVELTFTSPETRPAVKVLANDVGQPADAAFVKSVKDHVSAWRVPCLTEDEGPSRLVVAFNFRHDNRKVHWSQPLNPESVQRREMLRCVTHAGGQKAPAYPLRARQNEIQGRVVARLRFDAPDKPPGVTLFARKNHRILAEEVGAWVQDFRMPCQQGDPVIADWTFVYRLGSDYYGFNPLTLRQFMAGVRGIRDQTVAFDTTTMRCPFAVKIQYLQPLRPNVVGEVDEAVPEREAFLRWLSAAELDVPPNAADAIFADTLTLDVPCVKINLNPTKE